MDAAGLTEVLKGDGPFTVFAPTDDAFNALPPGVLDALLADPSGALADVLLYHVMPGRHTSQSVLARNSYRMLNGDRLPAGELYIADTDISARNGVVHVINTVLIPSE